MSGLLVRPLGKRKRGVEGGHPIHAEKWSSCVCVLYLLCHMVTQVCFNESYWRNLRVNLHWSIRSVFWVFCSLDFDACFGLGLGSLGWLVNLPLTKHIEKSNKVCLDLHPHYLCCWTPRFLSGSKREPCCPGPPCCYQLLTRAALSCLQNSVVLSQLEVQPLIGGNLVTLSRSWLTLIHFHPSPLNSCPIWEAFRTSPAPDLLSVCGIWDKEPLRWLHRWGATVVSVTSQINEGLNHKWRLPKW